MPRYRITFAKTEAMRFTGNLDVHRTWERAFRRAGLPLAYSQGFSPHPRMTLAAALPLGCLSEADLLDVWLTGELSATDVREALRHASPPGILVEDVVRLEGSEPSLPSQVEAAEYEAALETAPQGEPLAARCASLLASARVLRQRRGKDYDLRPLIEHLDADEAGRRLRMRLAAREGATGRPDEVLLAMGLDPADAVCVRKRLFLEVVVSH
jgi:radical SAM-linked protein